MKANVQKMKKLKVWVGVREYTRLKSANRKKGSVQQIETILWTFTYYETANEHKEFCQAWNKSAASLQGGWEYKKIVEKI